MRDLPSSSFDGEVHTPRDQTKVDLLAPPEMASFFCNNLQRILVIRSVIEPSNHLESSRVFSGSKCTFVPKYTANGQAVR